jgi:hypothetical protein
MAASLFSDDETISASEYLIRVANVRVTLRKADLLRLLSFGDCRGDTNVCYFTEAGIKQRISNQEQKLEVTHNQLYLSASTTSHTKHQCWRLNGS